MVEPFDNSSMTRGLRMSQAAIASYVFATDAHVPLEATFDGGHLTSNGGLPWLAAAEAELGICAAFASFLADWRTDPDRAQHSLEHLVRRRSSSSPAAMPIKTLPPGMCCSVWPAG